MNNTKEQTCRLSRTDWGILVVNVAAFGGGLTLLLQGTSGVPVVLLLIGTGLATLGKLLRVCSPARRSEASISP